MNIQIQTVVYAILLIILNYLLYSFISLTHLVYITIGIELLILLGYYQFSCRSHKINILLDLDHTLIYTSILQKHTDPIDARGNENSSFIGSDLPFNTVKSQSGNNSAERAEQRRKGSQELIEGLEKSSIDPVQNNCHIILDNNRVQQVYLRPGLDSFLKALSTKFNLHIQTAGTKNQAERIVNEAIDPDRRYIKKIFSRENCMQIKKNWLKKISFTGMSEANTILIDDNEKVVSINAMNSLLIKKLDSLDEDDEELSILANLLVQNMALLESKKTISKEKIANELTFHVLQSIHKNKIKDYLDQLKKISDSVTDLIEGNTSYNYEMDKKNA